jgi:serine/threonine protein kinase
MEGYDIERVVGEGSYGKAILAKNKKDSKKVIIKVSHYNHYHDNIYTYCKIANKH